MSAIIPSPILRGYLAGLLLSNDSTTPNSVIDISAGQATDSSSSVLMTSSGSLTVNFSTTGSGALDTGAIAASTWYHVFLIAAASGTVAGLASTSITPSLPTGYTYYRRIGSVKTDGSSHILAFKQDEETFYWGVATLDVNGTSISTGARTLITINVPTAVKVRPLIRFSCNNNSAITSPDEPDGLNGSLSGAPGYDINSSASPGTAWAGSFLYTNTSAQLGISAYYGTGTAYVVTRGWIDGRGRFA